MTKNEDFFRSQDTHAVLKHGILRRYPDVFASAAGSNSSRVVFLDGYAGPGRYEDDTPGSPVLFLESAARVSSSRAVECILVERDPKYFAKLQSVANEHCSAGVVYKTYEGDLSTHLETILNHSSDAALFAFLDPFGTALSYEEMAKRLLDRPEHPPTEVLLHFSVNAIRRIGGLLHKNGGDVSAMTDTEQKTIQRADHFLGGNWWHPIATSADDVPGSATKAAEEVVRDYCERIRARTGYRSGRFPVRARPDLLPEYYLVLFSRHAYAHWRFNDALSMSNVDWQKAWREKENTKLVDKDERTRQQKHDEGIYSLFEDQSVSSTLQIHLPYNEIEESVQWVQIIEANLCSLLSRGIPFRLIDEISNVYGDTLGFAREKHVRIAVKNLHAQQLCNDDGKRDFYNRWISQSK